MQSEVGCSSEDRGLSLVSVVSPTVGEKPKPVAEVAGSERHKTWK